MNIKLYVARITQNNLFYSHPEFKFKYTLVLEILDLLAV